MDLPDQPLSLPNEPDALHLWYAVSTKYKHEKRIAEYLESQGIIAYVPLRESVKKYKKSLKVHLVPLISCYVFVKILPEDKSMILGTMGVNRFIGTPIPKTIRDEEIDILKKLTAYNLEVEANPKDYTVGSMVYISEGPFLGKKGRIIMQRGKLKFLLRLEDCEISFAVEVPKDILLNVNEVPQ